QRGDLGWVDRGPALPLRNEPGALDLRSALGPLKRMPTAFALPRLWIARVENDRPVAGRALTDMASHLFPPFLLFECSETLARLGNVLAGTEPLKVVRECRGGAGAHGIGPDFLVLLSPSNQCWARFNIRLGAPLPS